MKRRLFHFLAASSAVLLVLTCALWIRAQFANDQMGWVGWRDEHKIIWRGWGWNVYRGGPCFHWFSGEWIFENLRYIGPPPEGGMEPHFFAKPYPPDWRTLMPNSSWLQRRGFDWHVFDIPRNPSQGLFRPETIHFVSVPFWFLAILFAMLPVVYLWGRANRVRARRRVESGLCAVCGYDLRASVHRCPECGTAVSVLKPNTTTN